MKPTAALIPFASLFLLAASIQAAEPPQPPTVARTPTAKLTRTQNSNPQSCQVRCAVQDRAGDIWFGTTGEGIYRYDGKAFTQFTKEDGLPSNIVWCAIRDDADQLWFGTDAGLCRWNGTRFDAVPLPPLPGAKTTTPPTVWSLLQDSRKTIWIGTSEGMLFSKSGTISPFLEPGQSTIANPSKLHLKMIAAMLEDREGNVWFASGMPPGMEGLIRFDGTSLTQFKPGSQGWIRTVIEDSHGTLWMGTRHGGVWRYDGNDFSPFTEKRGTGSPMLVDHAGNIWFGGEEDDTGLNLSGVYRYDGKTFDNFKIGNILGGYGFWSITQDRSNNIWLGTRNTGLYRFDGKNLISLSEQKP